MNPDEVGDALLRPALTSKAPHFRDVGLSQLGATVLSSNLGPSRIVAKRTIGVRHIFRRCACLKIGESVVQFLAIQVVDLHPVGNCAVEGFPDQAVRAVGSNIPEPAEGEIRISATTSCPQELFARLSALRDDPANRSAI